MLEMMTMTTVTTVSTIAMGGLSGSFTLIGILVLLALLIQKELATGSDSPWAKHLKQAVNIGIAPLMMVFVLNVLLKVAAVFR
jgi:hypothetical protein